MFKDKKFDVKDCLGREYFKHAQKYPHVKIFDQRNLQRRIYDFTL